jgi:hypothetical protein
MSAKHFLCVFLVVVQFTGGGTVTAASDSEIIWGQATNGIRAGIKLEPTSSGTLSHLYVAYTEDHVSTLLSGVNSTNLARYNVPPPDQAFDAILRNKDGQEVTKTADGKKHGKPLPKRTTYRRRGWVTLLPKPMDVGTFVIENHFEVRKRVETYELEVNLWLFSYQQGKQLESVKLPPVRVKVLLPSK